ncbi:unnamed protein product [Ixodes persulcatus]
MPSFELNINVACSLYSMCKSTILRHLFFGGGGGRAGDYIAKKKLWCIATNNWQSERSLLKKENVSPVSLIPF